MAGDGKLDPKLENAMRASLKAYATGSKRFLEYLLENVRMYTLDSSEPIVGRKAFESYFGPLVRAWPQHL
jgi:hypothetical protein